MQKRINMILWWVFLIVYIELVYRLLIIKNLFSINTLSVFLFCIPFSIFFSIITSVFNKNINKVINNLLSIFIIIFIYAQVVYYNFYHSIISFYSLTHGVGQVMHFYSAIIDVIIDNWISIILFLLPILLLLLFNKKMFDYNKISNNSLGTSISFLVLIITSIFLLVKFDKKDYSYNYLINKTHAPLQTVNKVGILTTQLVDIYKYIFKFKESVLIDTINTKKEYSVNHNILNIDFENLIKKEKDEDIILMHNYFNNEEVSNKNNYTSSFKDKNLIFITAESLDSVGINKELTPTLYKIVNNGFVFKNFYQPLYPISTSDGEYMNLTGLIPKEGTWSSSYSSNKSMPFALGNMFKNNGYKTFAYHNNDFSFYNRDKSHPNFGFTYVGCGNGLEKEMDCSLWPNSDYEMIKATIKDYIDEEKFLAYYMSVSNHLSYDFKNNDMSILNKEKVKNTDYSNKIKAYYASNIELDKAIEYLIKTLEEKDILKDTLIVIIPDHYPYGLTINEINKLSSIDRGDKFENYHTSLIMYNPNIKKIEINDVVSGLDVIPTIYNLFGFNYDSRLLIGKDIFSDNEKIVYFSDRSFITNKGKYNSISGKFVSFKDSNVSNEYINSIIKKVNQRFSISSLILDNNYYEKLVIE